MKLNLKINIQIYDVNITQENKKNKKFSNIL